MSFSIEALQSKSKLNNIKSRQFSRQTLWPELMPREDESIVQNFKSAVHTALTKVKEVLGQRQHHKSYGALIVNSTNGDEAADVDGMAVVVDSQESNSEGFVEVSLGVEK